MSRGKAILLAVFTVWPLLYMFFFMGSVFVMMMSAFADSRSEPPVILLILIPLHFLTMFEILVLLVIYLRHLFKTNRVPQDKKALWAVVLLLGNMIAMPVYWYLHIWREQESPRLD